MTDEKLEEKASFKADNYGEVIAVVHDLELVSYEENGKYSGEYLAVLKDEDRLFYFIGDFGSCSGCDELEDIRDYTSRTIAYKEAVKLLAGKKPSYIVPKDKPLTFKKIRVEFRERWKLLNK